MGPWSSAVHTPLQLSIITLFQRYLEQSLFIVLLTVWVKMSLKIITCLHLWGCKSQRRCRWTHFPPQKQLSALKIHFRLFIAITFILLEPSEKLLIARPCRLMRSTELRGHLSFWMQCSVQQHLCSPWCYDEPVPAEQAVSEGLWDPLSAQLMLTQEASFQDFVALSYYSYCFPICQVHKNTRTNIIYQPFFLSTHMQCSDQDFTVIHPSWHFMQSSFSDS